MSFPHLPTRKIKISCIGIHKIFTYISFFLSPSFCFISLLPHIIILSSFYWAALLKKRGAFVMFWLLLSAEIGRDLNQFYLDFYDEVFDIEFVTSTLVFLEALRFTLNWAEKIKLEFIKIFRLINSSKPNYMVKIQYNLMIKHDVNPRIFAYNLLSPNIIPRI